MMKERIQYDEEFKKAVVKLLESGELSSLESAKKKLKISGSMTVSNWVRSIKPDLLPKLKIRKLKDELQLLKESDPELYSAIQKII